MTRTRIKICGITRLEDALSAIALGADALGFVFYPPSPRYVSPVQAAAIVAQLPPFVTTVGLFVDASAQEIAAILAQVPLSLLQFHGDESAEACLAYKMPFIKAVRVQAGLDLVQYALRYSAAQGLLLDAFVAGVPGGTGQAFDWRLIPSDLSLPVILAGGLIPDNVAEAVQKVQPYAVDVSGGVEASKGVKDYAKMQTFIQEVTHARL
jgi:phosphoribosylanthranilate isomerase